MTKCLHEPCQKEAEELSAYCGDCIQLPTEDCVNCNRVIPKKPSKNDRITLGSSKSKGELNKELQKILDDRKEQNDRQTSFLWNAAKLLLYFIVGFTILKWVFGW